MSVHALWSRSAIPKNVQYFQQAESNIHEIVANYVALFHFVLPSANGCC